MPQSENYFEILGIAMGASFGEIERAYRAARKQAEADPARLKLIDEAYQTLINPFKKEAYVKKLSKPSSQAPGEPAPEVPQTPVRRKGTSVFGVETTPEPPVSGGEKPSGNRNKTQVFTGSSQPPARTPEPKPSTPPANSVPPASSGKKERSGTQIFEGSAPATNRTPEPRPQANPPAAGNKPAGRSRTQITGAGGPTAEPAPQAKPKPKEQPAPAVEKPAPKVRTHTVIMGQDTPPDSGRKPIQPQTGSGGTGIVEPGGKPAGKSHTNQFERPQPANDPGAPQGAGQKETKPLDIVTPPKPREDHTVVHTAAITWEVVVRFEGQERVVALTPGKSLVGRPPKDGPQPAIPLPDPDRFVSRSHANLYLEGDQVYVEDLNTPNGTLLNGTRLPPHLKTALKVGDEILIEGRRIQVRLVKAGA